MTLTRKLPEMPKLPKIAEIETKVLPRINADECGSGNEGIAGRLRAGF
jgi:hypothetical protein